VATVLVVTMDDREAKLGFKPQKEVPYNALLPYADSLDAESNDQLAHIKANLARVVQLRDIKIGGSHWSGQLGKLVFTSTFFGTHWFLNSQASLLLCNNAHNFNRMKTSEHER